ncbi:alpha/beta fold hydrolase [Maribacter sp. X9]|uniref:alpha/beta fold hydrolase n=1 Tax=Maribacter sp. X9 TaxID=3402159 RepID=UPI003AF356DA
MKSILIATGILLSLSLGIQTHASGLFKTDDATGEILLKKDSTIVNKKSIALSTGIQMEYREAGNSDGRTIVLIHGYTDTSRSFENVKDVS